MDLEVPTEEAKVDDDDDVVVIVVAAAAAAAAVAADVATAAAVAADVAAAAAAEEEECRVSENSAAGIGMNKSAGSVAFGSTADTETDEGREKGDDATEQEAAVGECDGDATVEDEDDDVVLEENGGSSAMLP